MQPFLKAMKARPSLFLHAQMLQRRPKAPPAWCEKPDQGCGNIHVTQMNTGEVYNAEAQRAAINPAACCNKWRNSNFFWFV